MKYFLLDYDRAAQRLVSVAPIEDTAEALAAYSEREREALGTSHEVVLLGGESEDDLRRTHSRYFHANGAPAPIGEIRRRLERVERLVAGAQAAAGA